ncbi:hypothetical protein [Euzebya pacifica]|uniref:hypothetical protein n=1 Tax=Euzebya pacifica TaxID=1608957 RepID=UPI000DF7FC0B|nr:hypothetical protein [Euzebya pacifica]
MTHFPLSPFGDDASVAPLVVHDCEMMLGIITSRTGRWAALAVDEIDGGSWLYLTVPIGPDVTGGALVDPARLRSLYADPAADVRELADLPSGTVHEPVVGPIREAWLPVAVTP